MMPSEQVFYSDASGTDHSIRSMTASSRHRPASALDHNSHSKVRWGHRPKSTPISVGQRHPSHQSSKISRPKTAAVILGRTECDRVHQLEHEPTRRQNLETHFPLKRTKPPPWQKNLDTPLVPFQTGPGYILTRSKTKCHVTIKDEFFEPIQDENNRKKTPGDSERKPNTFIKRNGTNNRVVLGDNLIVQLQQQISDLTLYLEEERLNHRQSKQKAEEFLRDKMDQMSQQHQDHVRDMESDHKEEIHKVRQQMNEEHSEVQTTMETQISRMAKEIEFLQGAFESYKSTLHTETSQKWNAKEEEMKMKLTEEKQQALHEMKTKFIHERNQERAASAKDHQKAIEALRKENKREMDSLIRRFSNAATDIEKLKKTTAELEETKSELDQVKESYNTTCQQLANTTRHLTDTKLRLMEFEEKFQEKVTQVDDKYRHKLQELMTQNTELKRLFVQKCGELFNEKTNTDYETSQRVKTAKETMETLIKSKRRANVSIALGGPEEKIRDGKTRPLSAPGTRHETESAHETAGETKILKKQREFIPPDINLEPNPETEEIRTELLSSGRVGMTSKEDLLRSLDDL